MSLAISVENVSKVYHLGSVDRSLLWRDARRWLRHKFSPNRDPDQVQAEDSRNDSSLFWALKDVDFDIKEGETVGIVGRNGAGKSTLLKIISRITAPTAGTVKIRGRMGSMLEVGTGFHPELTGRDNLFLYGAILGMKRDEIRAKLDEIVAFAEVEKFIDTPIKRYSSGMYMRLAFSVAAFLEPEILIVDEVLAVGDQQFQNRCMRRIEQIVRDGRTLLFVAHNAGVVKKICRRAILLRHGELICDGDASETIDAYNESVKQDGLERGGESSLNVQDGAEREWPDLATAPGGRFVRVCRVRVLDESGGLEENLPISQPFSVEVDFVVLEGGRHLQPCAMLMDGLGNVLFWSADTDSRLRRSPLPKGNYRARMEVPGEFLTAGPIMVNVGIVQFTPTFEVHAQVEAASINILDDFSPESIRGGYTGIIPGLIRPRMKWVTESAG